MAANRFRGPARRVFRTREPPSRRGRPRPPCCRGAAPGRKAAGGSRRAPIVVPRGRAAADRAARVPPTCPRLPRAGPRRFSTADPPGSCQARTPPRSARAVIGNREIPDDPSHHAVAASSQGLSLDPPRPPRRRDRARGHRPRGRRRERKRCRRAAPLGGGRLGRGRSGAPAPRGVMRARRAGSAGVARAPLVRRRSRLPTGPAGCPCAA